MTLINPKPIDTYPYLFRDQDGRIINMLDFSEPFETSCLFPTISLAVTWDMERILRSWRLSVAQQPANLAELQQLACLFVNNVRIATATAHTLLTEQPLPHRLIQKDVHVGVSLVERPVEGAGLRLHLRGIRRQKSRNYGDAT